MDQAELASLVAALTPRVANARRQLNQSRATHILHCCVATGTSCSGQLPQHDLNEPTGQSEASALIGRPSGSVQPCDLTPHTGLQRCTFNETFRRQRHTPYMVKKRKAAHGRGVNVILLPDQHWSSVVKGKTRVKFHEDGLLIDKFMFDNGWSERDVIDALHDAFREKLTTDTGEKISFRIMKPEGVVLLQPRIAPNDSLNGRKICEIFTQKTMYLSPDKKLRVLKEKNEDQT